MKNSNTRKNRFNPSFNRAALLMLAVAATPALAASDTWAPPLTPIDNNWLTASNWAANVAPSNGDSLTFAGAINTNANNNFSAATFDGLAFSSTASTFNLSGNAIDLGVTLTSTVSTAASGDIINNSTNTQNITLAAITLDAGAHYIYTPTSANLNITSTFNLNKGSVAFFNTSGGGAINFTGSSLANDASASGGILGGNAIFGGTNLIPGNYATLDANKHVVAYTGYSTINGNGALLDDPTQNFSIIANNTGATTAALPAPITHINTLLLSSSGANTAAEIIAIGAGNTLVLGQNGGILNASGTGGNTLRNLTIGASAAAGGILTAGSGSAPANITFSAGAIPNAAGVMTINSQITDNSLTGPVSVTYTGGFFTTTNTNNSYTGGTTIVTGRVSQALGGIFGSGPVTILPGGEINTTSKFTNNFFLSGNGTMEQPGTGLGALRLFGTAATTNLSGIITLTADTGISVTNNANAQITGQITGPGALTLGHNNGGGGGAGILLIGSTTAPGTPNNYAGDTTLAGLTAGTGNNVLEINTPFATNSNDNMLPHGPTGSFAGGPTGNLLIDSVLSSHNATFDLNGTTQTINALSSTTTNANGDIIQSSTSGGVLILGDSNASGTYYGTIQDAGGLSLRKIGSGTETFAAAPANQGSISYSGDTNINGGTLVAANSMSSANINLNTTSASTTFIGAGNFNNITLAPNNASFKATFSIGTSSTPGSIASLTASSLTINGGTLSFDLASPGTSDSITVNGPVTFSAAASIVPHAGIAGSYTLLTSNSGPITYTVTPTVVSPSADPLLRPTTYTLDTLSNPNAINLTVTGGSLPLTWSGAANSTWAVNTPATKNFTSTGPDVFFNQDAVTFSDGPGNRTITISGSVLPSAVIVNANAGNDYTFSTGTIDGTTALSKSNAGNLTLTSNNSYSGGTNINAGTVTVGNNTSAGSLGSGNITFTNTADLVLARSDAISLPNIISGPGNVTIGKTGGTSNVTITSVNNFSGLTNVSPGSTLVISSTGSINGSAGVNLNGSTEIINGANANADFGNALNIGPAGATIKFGAATSLNAFANNAITVNTTPGGTLTIDLNDSTQSIKSYTIPATFSGAGDIAFTNSQSNPNTGAGSLNTGNFTGSLSSDTGNLSISGGVNFKANNNNAIPTGSISVASGSELFLNGTSTYTNNFSIAGPGAQTDIPTLGALHLTTGTTLSGNIALPASALITVGTAAANTATLNGQISGPGTLSLASGSFTLANLTPSPSSYGPSTPGSIATFISNISGRTASVTVNDANSISHNGLQLQGGNLLINGFDIAFTNLSSAPTAGSPNNGGNITNAASSTNTLSFGSDNSSQSFAGIIGDGSAGGFLNVTKNGTGTETFSNNQTYSGNTTINAGGGLAFTATGSLSSSTNVTANGSLSFAAPTQSLASLNGTGEVSLNTTALTITNPSSIASIVDNNNSNASVSILSSLQLTGSTPSKFSSLLLSGSYGGSASAISTYTSALDLTNSKLIIEDATANRPADLAQLINQALASNTANSTVGIYSSTAAAFNTAAGKTVKVVAVSDNAVRIATFPAGSTNFGAVNNVDANSILITATFKGDANLDGVVDIQDLTDVANHWQQSVTDWSQGDFDGSNFVDISDLTAIANNWQAGVGSSSSLSVMPSFTPSTATPEPTSLALLALGGLLTYRRRPTRTARRTSK